MWLTQLEADRLRNLGAVKLGLEAGLTVISGRNGQGKTSLLEAIYLLGTGRSFKTRRIEDLVAWEGGPLRVAGSVVGRLGQTEMAVLVDGAIRRLLADGLEQDLESYLWRLAVVDLTAERMNVLRGSPVERRRFLDRGITGIKPVYLRALGEYRRVLQQRNALLRGRQRLESQRLAELNAWDERLIQSAVPLHIQRRQYAVRLAAKLGEVTRVLFTEEHALRLHYRPSPAETGQSEPGHFGEAFNERLQRGRARDLAVGHTCTGPHRDDVLIELNGVDLRRFGSAGQVRAAMIALKLGKLSLLEDERGEAPLFLMDDFDSDLDEVRASSLAAFLEHGKFQAVVATSKEAMAERLGVAFRKVRMDGGSVRPV